MAGKRIPLYLKELYGDFYNKPKLCAFFDKNWVQTCLTFGNNKKLITSLLNEVYTSCKALQLGCTFGRQMEETASKIGIYGIYDILDISHIQLKRCKEKFDRLFPQIRYVQQNANIPLKKNYDVVILYMLLHEVPHRQKAKIIQAALDSIKEGGKVVIIDYHKPKIWHPLRFFVKSFNRLYQPFAEILWDKGLETFVKDKSKYLWKKTLYFGGFYQKVVIQKKFSDEFADEKPCVPYQP